MTPDHLSHTSTPTYCAANAELCTGATSSTYIVVAAGLFRGRPHEHHAFQVDILLASPAKFWSIPDISRLASFAVHVCSSVRLGCLYMYPGLRLAIRIVGQFLEA